MAAWLPAWVRAFWEPADIVESRKLVQELNLPESSAQFVLALRPVDSPDAVVYVLSSLYFSEKAASDARELIAAVHPKAVVSLVDLEAIQSYREEEKLASVSGGTYDVPTSSLGVIQENLVRDPNIVPYSSRARIQLARSMFGTGLFSDVLEARQAAAESDAIFRYIDFPYRSVSDYEPEDPSAGATEPQLSSLNGSEHFRDADDFAATRRAIQGLKAFESHTSLDELRKWREACSVALAESFGHKSNWAFATSSTQRIEASELPPESSQELDEVDPTPEFAKPLLPLLMALNQVCQTAALEKSLQCALKMFQDVETGKDVESIDLLEACRFRIALEMSRVQANNFVSASSSKVPKAKQTAHDFHSLSYEDKCYALLAQSLQKQARESGTVVAVIDVNRVPGIRQQWKQPIPEEFTSIIDECYISVDELEEVSLLETLFSTESKSSGLTEAGKENNAAVVVGAGVAAAVGLAYLPSWAAPLSPLVKFVSAQASTVLKIGFLNTKRALALSVAKGLPGASKVVLPSIKATAAKSTATSTAKLALSAEKAQAAAQGLVSGLQRQTLQAIRTTFYSVMRKTANKPVGRRPWLLFGSSVMAGGAILFHGDKVERALGSVPTAPSVAKLGRGLESLNHVMDQTLINWSEIYHDLYNRKAYKSGSIG